MKGCGISCLVLLAVLLGGTVAGGIYGKRWVAEKLPEWEERVPAIGLLRGALEIKRGLGEIGEAVPMERRPGTSDPAALPPDIPRPPAEGTAAFSVGDGWVLVYREVRGSPAQAAAAQLRAWRGKGWRLQGDEPWGDRGRYLTLSKGPDRCILEILQSAQGTEVWAEVSRGAREEETP